jgi:Thioredoxin-like
MLSEGESMKRHHLVPVRVLFSLSLTAAKVFAVAATLLLCVSGQLLFAQTASTPHVVDIAPFAPLEEWKNAIVAGDAAKLKTFYSTDPAAEINANSAKASGDDDANFWLGLKARSATLEMVRTKTPRPDIYSVIFNAQIVSAAHEGKTVVVADSQLWQQQAGVWRLRAAERTDFPHLAQPSNMKKQIYPPDTDAHAEIAEAEQKAAPEHKRLLLVFGANWCYDCHVLDLAFQRPDLAPVLASRYEVVHIDLGDDGKKNPDLVAQYEIPLNKGIPALAVAGSDGKLIVSQKNGEFENARGMTPEALSEFLNKWKQ